MNRRSVLWCLAAVEIVIATPTWQWYARRMHDGSDEPWGIAALGAAVGCCFLEILRDRAARTRAPRRDVQPDSERQEIPLWLLVGSLLGSLLAFISSAALPPIIRAGIVVLAIGTLISSVVYRSPCRPGFHALLLLSLPVIPTLQFYLGYPLRLASSYSAAALLQLFGVAVVADGTALRYGQQLIWIDAPCSGVSLLWAAMVCVMTSAALLNCSLPRTVALGGIALTVAVAANGFRAIYLFTLEIAFPRYPPQLHSGIGVAVDLTALCILGLSARFIATLPSRKSTVPSDGIRHRGDASANSTLSLLPARPLSIAGIALIVLVAFAPEKFLTAPVPPVTGDVSTRRNETDESIWPREFNGSPLIQLALSERELRFAGEFPGETRRYATASGDEVIIRLVRQPTRKLHPAAHCLRGAGFTVTHDRAQLLQSGIPTGCTIASRKNERFRVCEFITDVSGRILGDVSEWYWTSLLGNGEGPWLSYVVATKLR